MDRHQAVRVSFGDGGDVQPILLQKEVEILFFPEHILEPIGMVENMIAGIGLQRLHIAKMKYFLYDQS
jgi:hypothetical protein